MNFDAQAMDITNLGSLKEAAKIFVPGSSIFHFNFWLIIMCGIIFYKNKLSYVIYSCVLLHLLILQVGQPYTLLER
jgi:hypothetical protein